MALVVRLQYEADEDAAEKVEDTAEQEVGRCGATFRPSWQPTLWCACDRPRGHGGDHFGMPRSGDWGPGLPRIG